jgi:hypothetical protein
MAKFTTSINLVYAKTGTTLDSGLGFVFTGNMSGSDWEIDLPTSSNQAIHGITSQFVDEYTAVPAFIFGAGPQYGQLSSNVLANDDVACDSAGKFHVKGLLDVKVGTALTAGTSGSAAVIFLIS